MEYGGEGTLWSMEYGLFPAPTYCPHTSPLHPHTYQGILSDLFPGVVLPEHDYGVLQSAIEDAARSRGLQVVPAQVCLCV